MNNPIKKFEKEKQRHAARMNKDKKLRKIALDLITNFSQHKYSYFFSWLGRPIIQMPEDVVVMQEIIWKTRPDLIIETGIAHGGSLIFYASILELLGKGKVLGIDIDIRKHNRKEIEKHRMFKRIKMIEGSSIDADTIKKVISIAKKYKKILVCLDSNHTHDHVLKELDLYAPFVSAGSYLVAFDTAIEYTSGSFYENAFKKGDNPAIAVADFLKNNKNFIV